MTFLTDRFDYVTTAALAAFSIVSVATWAFLFWLRAHRPGGSLES